MNRTTVAAIIAASIVVIPASVKARAADLPNVSPVSRKTELRDSVKDRNDEFKELVDFMMRYGNDLEIGKNLAPSLGLADATPSKAKTVRPRSSDEKRSTLNCAVAYAESDDATSPDSKRPICIFLQTFKHVGEDSESRFFRLSLDGQLERVYSQRGKLLANGRGVPGSAVGTDEDVDSPEVKKALAAEMVDLRAWLKYQQKLLKKSGGKAPAAAAGSSAAK